MELLNPMSLAILLFIYAYNIIFLQTGIIALLDNQLLIVISVCFRFNWQLVSARQFDNCPASTQTDLTLLVVNHLSGGMAFTLRALALISKL